MKIHSDQVNSFPQNPNYKTSVCSCKSKLRVPFDIRWTKNATAVFPSMFILHIVASLFCLIVIIVAVAHNLNNLLINLSGARQIDRERKRDTNWRKRQRQHRLKWCVKWQICKYSTISNNSLEIEIRCFICSKHIDHRARKNKLSLSLLPCHFSSSMSTLLLDFDRSQQFSIHTNSFCSVFPLIRRGVHL